MSKVSIIVPVYNSVEHLSRCIDSILCQTLHDIEIILINDGSTDNSGDICNHYAESDKRIKVLHKKNAGQGLARNDGIAIAKGEYIGFVDSDDFIEPDMYEVMYNKARQSDADMITCGYYRDSSNSRVIESTTHDDVFSGVECIEYMQSIIGDDFSNKRFVHSTGSVWSSIYKRENIIINNIRFLSERQVLSEDSIFNLTYIPHCKRIITISAPFYHYCLNEGSFSKKFSDKRVDNMLDFHKLLTELSYSTIGIDLRNNLQMRLDNMLIRHSIMAISDDVKYNPASGKKTVSKIIHLQSLNEALKRQPFFNLSNAHKIIAILMKLKLSSLIFILFRIKNGKQI